MGHTRAKPIAHKRQESDFRRTATSHCGSCVGHVETPNKFCSAESDKLRWVKPKKQKCIVCRRTSNSLLAAVTQSIIWSHWRYLTVDILLYRGPMNDSAIDVNIVTNQLRIRSKWTLKNGITEKRNPKTVFHGKRGSLGCSSCLQNLSLESKPLGFRFQT